MSVEGSEGDRQEEMKAAILPKSGESVMSQLRWLLVGLTALIPAVSVAQQAKPKAMVGAYYFDGWSGGTDEIHLTKLLTTEYADRKPVWGWRDDTVEIMQKQIDYCADHDIAFWAFDWYYPEGKTKTTPLNNALGLYLKAPNRQRLKFCLLVANHEGFRIGPKDWDTCCENWIELFQKPTHLRLGGQPLLIILSHDELQKAFGGVDGVRKALDSLRAKAKKVGLPGVSIATCTSPGGHLGDLSRSGYTLLTGYNYPLGVFNGSGSQPFRKLIEGSEQIFNQFAQQAPLPYVPVITAGWDRRPWEQGQYPAEKMSAWYADRTPKQVEEFVRLGVRWMDKHPDKTTPQRLLLIYAWNENGEGGYLTPTEKDGTEYLKAVQRAVADREMPWVKVAEDKHGFILSQSGQPFIPWGFNYDHDEEGRLLEDYWEKEWPKVEADFQEMKQLGANVARVHLQLDKFMTGPDKANEASLGRLDRLVTLSEKLGIYLDITGLGCYRKRSVPEWYDRLDEKERWNVQARFWQAVVQRCAKSPAVFCYDLMNEPVVPGGKRNAGNWLGPPFMGGECGYFVQFITLDQADRPRPEIARQWCHKLVKAIRQHDQRHLITVGLVPWSLDRPGLTSGFVPKEIAPELDFIAVHLYPETGKVDEALDTLKGFSVGKPVVIEEMFPLNCSMADFERFIDQGQKTASGWIGFYWGKTPEECRKSSTIQDALILGWLEFFQKKTQAITGPAQERGTK
jgi:hypothetical protein